MNGRPFEIFRKTLHLPYFIENDNHSVDRSDRGYRNGLDIFNAYSVSPNVKRGFYVLMGEVAALPIEGLHEKPGPLAFNSLLLSIESGCREVQLTDHFLDDSSLSRRGCAGEEDVFLQGCHILNCTL